MIGLYYAHPDRIPAEFHNSLMRLVLKDAIGAREIRTYGWPCGVNVTGRRNDMVTHFLETDGEWMLQLDCDMTFTPDLVDRLLAIADPVDAPIVGGLYFRYTPKMDRMCAPHLYAWHQDGSGLGTMLDYPRDTMLRVAATGAGCLLVHRGVLEKMAVENQGPWHWFAEQPYYERNEDGSQGKSTVYSEDLTFCLRAGACGFPIFVHTGITLGHLKGFELTVADFERERQP